MTSQLRMYTINRGMMDQWVKLFTETLVPMQEKHGIKITSSRSPVRAKSGWGMARLIESAQDGLCWSKT